MTMQEIVDQLRRCKYVCDAGDLENNSAFKELARLADSEKAQVGDIIQVAYDPQIPRTVQGQFAMVTHIHQESIRAKLMDFVPRAFVLLDYEEFAILGRPPVPLPESSTP